MCDDQCDTTTAGFAGYYDTGVTRRRLLGGMAGAGGLAALGEGLRTRPAAAAPHRAVTLAGTPPVFAAMHVHGSSSEQDASWESYGSRALEAGVDVVFMTDHGYRAIAHDYWRSLVDIPDDHVTVTTTGVLSRSVATKSGPGLRLLAEGARPRERAGVIMQVGVPSARLVWEHLRTSIRGQRLRVTFGPATMGDNARFELRVSLSSHPAATDRPAGRYHLWYRFGQGFPVGRVQEAGGLIGVVTRPLPAAGSTVTLDLESDVAAMWGASMMSTDNVFYNLAFAASSPGPGVLADVTLTGLSFQRPRHDPASFAADQLRLATHYTRRFGVGFRPAIELGHNKPHLNGFAVQQYVPSAALEELDVAPTIDAYCTRAVADLGARGGVASWNHPFGAFLEAPMLTVAQATVLRRETFATMLAKRAYGVTLLEVGYPVRNGMTIESHLALWDTLSRHGLILTGNGVSDDHLAQDWRSMENGFGTGLWSTSAGTGDLVSAMRRGRAYTRHVGRWPGGELDMLLAGRVPMGGVLLGPAQGRPLEVMATDLPANSTLEMVEGPVDHTGQDPATSVVARATAAQVGSDGSWSMTWRPSGPAFVRAQVRDSAGKVIGIGNPCFVLPESSRGEVAAERLQG